MVLLLTSIGAFSLSILSRFSAEAFLDERITIFGETIGLEHVENAGVAFGLSFPLVVQTLLIICALGVVSVLAYRSQNKRSSAVAFGLIIGGAIANIFDRFDDGFVTDFIQVGWWPTFNVADSCITVGVVMLIVFEVIGGRKKSSFLSS